MTARNENESEITVAGHNGETLSMRTLFHDQNSDHELHVIVSPDNMHVYIKAMPGVNFSGFTTAMIVEAIDSAGVRHGVIEPGIRLFVQTQNGSEPFAGFFQVARGDPMRRGENGSVEFHVQPTGMAPRYNETESGAIDYKQLNLIENCFAGQRIATILPPGSGRAGKDVFGAEIPAVPGDPAKVHAGSGVITSSTGREFSAEIEGRVVFENGVLSVSPVLEIFNDIDYNIGNVNFVGKVIVHGSLLDGFSINAQQGVELKGDMGAGHITSGGDVVIVRGIKGRNAAIIACRSLSAHYIDDATVEARGDVTATKEIVNSSVRALGHVRVTSGAIVGGDVCGFRGVEADTLGSDMGVATLVAAGLDWTEENIKKDLRTRIAEYTSRLDASNTLLEPMLSDKGIGAKLGEEQKAMLSDIVSELTDIRERLAELLEERSRLDKREHTDKVERVNARKMLRMGVTVRFPAFTSKVNDDVRGPLSIRPDERHATLSIGAFEELPKAKRVDDDQIPGQNPE